MGDNRLKFDKACPKCGSTSIATASTGTGYMDCKACSSRFRTEETAEPKVRQGKAKRYFITAAIEAQRAHTRALATVQRYCKVMKAELIIVPVSYWQGVSKNKKKRPFAKSVAPLLSRADVQLCSTVQVRGTININPTNLSPLTGLALAGHGDSFIIASAIMHQEFFKSAKYRTPCQSTTTGAITLPKYTRSRAGALAKEHHTCGGVIVEVEDNGSHFHLRHVGFRYDGSFIDLHTKWTVDGPTAAPPAEVLSFGDLHAAVRNRTAYDKQFETSGMVALLKPKNITLDDAFHGASIHKYQNVFERIVERGKGVIQSLGAELEETVKAIKIASAVAKTHVKESNHDRWLDQHMRAQDMWKYSGDADVIADVYIAMLTSAREGKVTLALAAYLNKYAPEVNTPSAEESLVLGDVEHVFHGDRGLFGTRGTLNGFAKMGTKTTFGHRHMAGRLRGACQSGTCYDGHGGPNNAQTFTHVAQYANNKRTLLTLVDGKFRREDALSAKLDKLS